MLISEIQRIVCAAILTTNGVVVCSARHFDECMHKQIAQMGDLGQLHEADQGFIDQWGNYLTREEALAVAKRQNQIRREVGGGDTKLYSEMLY